MKENFWLRPAILFAAIFGVVAIVGAQQDRSVKTKQATVDTPRTRTKDIDEALQQLEKARLELETTLKNSDWEKQLNESMKQLDAETIKLQVEQALKEADATKLQADMQKAMKEIDLPKIKEELQRALAEVDAGKIQKELELAMKDLDLEKMKKELDASLSKMDMEKMTAELKKMQEVDLKKMQEELNAIRPEIERSLSEAKIGVEAAKKELTAYKVFIGDLEKAGLVNKENYTIEYKKGELYINGKKQPDNIKNKFSNFLKDRNDFSIKKEGDHLDLDHD